MRSKVEIMRLRHNYEMKSHNYRIKRQNYAKKTVIIRHKIKKKN